MEPMGRVGGTQGEQLEPELCIPSTLAHGLLGSLLYYGAPADAYGARSVIGNSKL